MEGIKIARDRGEYEKGITDEVYSCDAEDLQDRCICREMQVYDLSASIQDSLDELDQVGAWAHDVAEEVVTDTNRVKSRAALLYSIDKLKAALQRASDNAI